MPKKNSHSETEEFDMEDDGEGDFREKAKKIKRSTEEIEAEKERKRLAREEKKFQKEHQKKLQRLERWVAPVLLILTIIISYIVWQMRK